MSEAKRLNLSTKEEVVKDEKNETQNNVENILEEKTPQKSAEQLADEERAEKLQNYLENPDLITPEIILKELENQGFKYTERFQKDFEKKFISVKAKNRQNLLQYVFEGRGRKFANKRAAKFYSWDFDVMSGGMRLIAFQNKELYALCENHDEYERVCNLIRSGKIKPALD